MSCAASKVILFWLQGDGLEFKKHFLEIRKKLHDIINRRVPAAMWPVLGAAQ